MKVLSIKEPYASLIVNGYKEYEFRSWKTKYRGKILIHASLSYDKKTKEKFKEYNLDYASGEIIGEAVISDCVKVDESLILKLRAKNPLIYSKSSYNETYAFYLTDVKKYEKRIPCKGKLGLWNYE